MMWRVSAFVNVCDRTELDAGSLSRAGINERLNYLSIPVALGQAGGRNNKTATKQTAHDKSTAIMTFKTRVLLAEVSGG